MGMTLEFRKIKSAFSNHSIYIDKFLTIDDGCYSNSHVSHFLNQAAEG